MKRRLWTTFDARSSVSDTTPSRSWLSRAGRRLQPLFNPDSDRARARFAAFVDEQRQAASVAQRRAAAQSERLTEVFRAVEQLRKLQRGLRSRVTRELQFSERVLRRVSERNVEIGEERVLVRLERLARGTGPVLVGPWAGEVGFELVYWIPFVRWALGHAGIDPARVTVLSRGGTGSWYSGLGREYAEVLDYARADEFRQQTAVSRKQRGLTAFDRELLRRVQRARGTAYGLIHPAMMYGLFYPYWRRDAPFSRVATYARFRRHEPPPLGALAGQLPVKYTAVRFYFSDCFPDTPSNRRFVASTVQKLAEGGDVVVLHGGGLDDHSDIVASVRGRVHVVDAGRSLRDNLEVQSAVIARASGFVGTYGGLSYLAPLYGIHSMAFYSHHTFQVAHLHAAQYMLNEIGGGTLMPLDVAQAPFLSQACGIAPSESSTE
jgi:hypothetical protein